MPDRDKLTYTLTRHNSTNMAPIDNALAAIKALKPGEKLVYQRFVNQYSVNRTTLAQRHKRVQAPQAIKDAN
jgi:hypothetical protein